MKVLGISAYYHDSAAALVDDGEIVAAAQEERFSRKKHDSSFPRHALTYCLSKCRKGAADIDWLVFYEKPLLKLERLLCTYVRLAPAGYESFRIAMPLWLRGKLFQKYQLEAELRQAAPGLDPGRRLLFCEHHLSHAASAFYPSPFDEAAILTIDGVGEWTTTSAAMGRQSRIEITKEIRFPHSLGLLYSAFTHYLGFRVNSGEYKVMGLAPYGRATYAGKILDNLISVKPDGSFRLDMSYFGYCTGLTMTSPKFDALFGGPARQPDEELTQRHFDLAASIQAVLETVVLRLSRSIAMEARSRNLCLAGGVALNCVANSRILHDGRFSNIWIQPAAGDAGGAIGAALAAYYLHNQAPRTPSPSDGMNGAFLGPEFSEEEIESALIATGARYTTMTHDSLLRTCVDALVAGKAVGWFQGRMEFGPRALGSRSILGDARSPSMQSVLNMKVKHRESFRPFAPAVLSDYARDWFDLQQDSAYMLLTAPVARKRRYSLNASQACLEGLELLRVVRSEIPAVTHVDNSARVQTVDARTNPVFYALLTAFHERTGCPVLVNTSFNVRGEPMVCTPADAFRCFMSTDIDVLAIGHCCLRKEEQECGDEDQYAQVFDPD
jgi:carbamoyltransferase